MSANDVYVAAKIIRRRLWFHPIAWRQVGVLKKKGRKVRAIYDTGERMPGGIPVLAVRKEGG